MVQKNSALSRLRHFDPAPALRLTFFYPEIIKICLNEFGFKVRQFAVRFLLADADVRSIARITHPNFSGKLS